ncbi:hypothetical protein H6P81_013436 [Aristolochia fimbriata]|uniref:Peptidase C45 hydrolase domain-containing protein n=1 Tax=Aristolochia fimbriata TaxID=158543 RepID=A0AAV7EEP3_ARIFI|nr:hypothetical protein H6P81_013436 [Aristolochia fimbriata]
MVLQVFHVGPCNEGYQLGFLIGQRFSSLIKSRVATDLVLQQKLLPFARSGSHAQATVEALSAANRGRYPLFWDELVGMAEGSGAALLDILLLNFRKEILPLIPDCAKITADTMSQDCSDVLIVNDSMAIAAHNEDANVALVGHVYLIRATLSNGLSFTAYTYAGELPSCAFGFNNNGLAFTLDSVPPSTEEIIPGGIGRNFVSRDLLNATGLDDAISRIRSSNVSVGHSYNLIDVPKRKIINVETASGKRFSIFEVGEKPFFHANMYLHLKVNQVHDDNSISRQTRAAQLRKESKAEILSLLGDSVNQNFPIYMTGPTLYTLCTAIIDLDSKTLTIIEGNPKKGDVSRVFPIL